MVLLIVDSTPAMRFLLYLLLTTTNAAAAAAAAAAATVTTTTASAEHSPKGIAAARSSDISTLLSVYQHNLLSVNIQEPNSGQTPLMASVLAGATQSVRVLLSQLNADPTIPEKDGYTPMHGASFQGRVDVARLLMERHQNDGDCPVDLPHKGDGLTPLWRTTWGREKRHVETGLLMIEMGGADPNYFAPKFSVNKGSGPASTPLQSAVSLFVFFFWFCFVFLLFFCPLRLK